MSRQCRQEAPLRAKVSGLTRPIEITSIALVLSQEGSAIILSVLFCFVFFIHSSSLGTHTHTRTYTTLTQFEAFFGSVQKFSHTVPGTHDLWNGLIYVNNVATPLVVVVTFVVNF